MPVDDPQSAETSAGCVAQKKEARAGGNSPVSPVQIPAVIYSLRQTAGLHVAALSLLDRLIVAAHRAGAGPITIIADHPLPSLKRTHALGISYSVENTAKEINGPVLLASTNVLVQATDVRRCLQTSKRLVSKGGEKLPIGVARFPVASLEKTLDSIDFISAEGVAHLVLDSTSAKAAESALWASMTSSSDGYIDKIFNRRCGRPLSKLLIHTPITPNMVSVTSILIGLLSAWFFAAGDHQSIIIGAILFQLSAIVDCVDGDIARTVFKESPLGKWLDLAGDQVVHISVFAAIAVGASKSGPASDMLWLGASAVCGALISFAVVVRGMRQQRTNGNNLLQKLIDSATNRDFSVLVFVLACFNKLHWFLWMAGIGSHLFWIAALSLQLLLKPSRRTS